MSIRKGRQFEWKVFGMYNKGRAGLQYTNLPEAIELVIYKQPNHWHPLQPPTQLGKEILDAVRLALSQQLQGRCDQVTLESIVGRTGLYCALGTCADKWHQTDGLICCDLDSVTPVVTIDLTVDDDGSKEIMRYNHAIIAEDHFIKRTASGKRWVDLVAETIAETLIFQLEWAGVVEIEKEAAAS